MKLNKYRMRKSRPSILSTIVYIRVFYDTICIYFIIDLLENIQAKYSGKINQIQIVFKKRLQKVEMIYIWKWMVIKICFSPKYLTCLNYIACFYLCVLIKLTNRFVSFISILWLCFRWVFPISVKVNSARVFSILKDAIPNE